MKTERTGPLEPEPIKQEQPIKEYTFAGLDGVLVIQPKQAPTGLLAPMTEEDDHGA